MNFPHRTHRTRAADRGIRSRLASHPLPHLERLELRSMMCADCIDCTDCLDPASMPMTSAPQPLALTATATAATTATSPVTWGVGLTDPGSASAWDLTGMPQGEFQTRLNFVRRATIDPLLAPGSTSFNHMHDFFVNPSIDENSTLASLMAAGTSRAAPASNLSAYWIPSLLNETTGQYVTPLDDSIAYYSVQKPLEPSKIVAMPAGLSMIAGTSMPTARQSTGIVFWNYIGTSTQYDHIPQGAEWQDLPLQAVVMFPQFWDGKSLGGTNFKDHMAYDRGGDGGPSDHPYLLPELSLQIHYGRVPRDARLVLSSDAMTKDRPGYAPGWSMHADFVHTPWPETTAAGVAYDGFERRVNDSLRWPTISGTDGNAVRTNPKGLMQPFTRSPIVIPGVLPAGQPAAPIPPVAVPVPSWARPGDANLDHTVDILDIAAITSSGKYDAASAATWTDGDFNGDARFDILDVAEIISSGLYDGGVYDVAPTPTPSPTPTPAPTLTVADRAFWEPMRGIGFSVGSLGAFTDQARLEGALRQAVSLGFGMIRTWGTDAYTGRILETITRLSLPLKVEVGIYITDDARARGQIDAALAVIAPYSSAVLAVSLGNEQIVDWNSTNTLTPQQVLGHVQYFRSKSSLPVTYNFAGETFLPGASQWSQNLAGLVAALDYVDVHTYGGFFDNRTNPAWTPLKQLDGVRSFERLLADRFAGLGLASKPILIGETGWQSTGYDPAVTNPQRMQEYYEAISRYVYGTNSRFDSMFYFNLTDESWKGGDDHWGLFGEGSTTSIGAAKFPVAPLPTLLGSNTTSSSVAAGSFPVVFANNTGGAWRDDQVFVTILGQTTPGAWSWIDAVGAPHALNHLDAAAAGHLVKNGVNYAAMSFTLAQAANLRIPPSLTGGRIYVSMGQPLYIGIAPDDSGFAGPDPANSSDPNFATPFDWYEMTYVFGKVPFGGNTTQVDQFGLSMTATLEQASSGYSTTRGLTATRAQVFASFAQQAPAAFQPLVVKDAAGNPLRILAPRTSTPGALATWLDGVVADFWTKFRAQPFTWNGPGYTVTGGIDAAGLFAYTVTSGTSRATYTMRKPTTQEIFACSGPFAGVGLQGAFLAELSAAFNRGVALSPDLWGTVTSYYPVGQRWNAFAKLFHDLGVEKYAYGFPYDDVTSQSSVQILGNSQPPTRLTLTVGG